MKNILVTGATGHLGSSVINHLINKTDKENIAALVRQPEKAKHLKNLGIALFKGDYNDYDSLVQTFKGFRKIYFVSTNDMENRNQQHKNVIEAAKTAGVQHIVYTGFQYKNETPSSPIYLVGSGHTYTNQLIKKSGMHYTILRHTMYMDFVVEILGDVLRTQNIYFPAGNGEIAFLSRNDMAEIGANILTSEGHLDKTYVIAGKEAFSFEETANLLTKITGKPITYTSPNSDEFIIKMKEIGIPELYVHAFLGFAEAAKQGEFDATNTEIDTLLGRKQETFLSFLERFYNQSK